MLGRPVTASTIPPMPPERMVSAKVQVVSVPLQPIAVCSSGIAGQRQTTDDSTTSTLASFERDFSGGNDSVEILLRLSQVDKKLEEMTGLMYSCLEGIESVKNARHGSANDDDDNKSSRPSSSQTQATNVSEPLPVNAEPARAWDDGAPVDFDDSPPNSVCRQDSHLNDDAWARPVQPIATPSQSGGGWRGMKTGFGDLMNRTLSSRQSDHEMPDPLNDNDSELSPNTRKRRASLVLVEKALSMFQEGRSPRVDAVWTFLEEGDSSRGAKIWTRVWCSFVCATVLLTLSQTLGPSAPLSGIIVVVLETMVEISFLVELIARLVTCPDMRHFLTSAFNLIDMASAMPLVLRMSNGFSPVATTDAASDPVYFVLLCVVPVIRLLKILRKEQLQLQLFEAVMDSVTESLQFLGFVGMCIVLVFAAMVFLVEPRDNIESFAHACWLVIVTMTTVGYGDVSPVTDRGRLIIAALVITSALYMALPIGVLGNAFAAVWKDRDLILLIEKTRRTWRSRRQSLCLVVLRGWAPVFQKVILRR